MRCPGAWLHYRRRGKPSALLPEGCPPCPPLRRSIAWEIRAGYSATALFALVVAVLAIAHIGNTNDELQRLAVYDEAISAGVLRLRLAVEQQNNSLRGYRLTGDRRDRELLEAARRDFTAATDTLWAVVPPGEGEQILERIEALYTRFDEAAASELALHEQGWHRTAEYLWHTSGRQAHEALVAQIQALAEWSAAANRASIAARARAAWVVKGLALGLVGAAAVLAVAAGFGLANRLQRPLATLAAAAAAIGAGNLAVRVPVSRDDELGLLAQSMNRMAENLERSRAELEASMAERARRSRALGVAEERNRLAREIHDTLAQGLTALTLQLEMADALLDDAPERARGSIQRALQLARANLQEARRSVLDLRAAPLEGLSLPEALEQLAAEFTRDHGVPCAATIQGLQGRLPARLETGLYRLAQEALANVAKHARPSRVDLRLVQQPGRLELIVADDGVGFDPRAPVCAGPHGGFGLAGMRERAALLGGQLVVDSAPGRGTRVVVQVPLAAGRAVIPA
ncbi:MAG TPA: histidine kinase [Chloroflexota bacterium]|jgi:signal transduction histidine kinase|nr:histidine kinase [Chloroflexota bacterium]